MTENELGSHTSEFGAVIVEGAVVIPIFLILVFTLIAFAQIMDARSWVQYETTRVTRSLSTVYPSCDPYDTQHETISQIRSNNQNTVEANLQNQGYQVTATIIPLPTGLSEPSELTGWQLSVTAVPPCPLCGILTLAGIYPGYISQTVVVGSEVTGCLNWGSP